MPSQLRPEFTQGYPNNGGRRRPWVLPTSAALGLSLALLGTATSADASRVASTGGMS